CSSDLRPQPQRAANPAARPAPMRQTANPAARPGVRQSTAAVNQRRDRMQQGGMNPQGRMQPQGNLSAQARRAQEAAAKASAAALRRAEESRAKTAAALKKQAAKAEKLRRKSLVAIHTITAEKKYAFPLAIVLIALCFTILILAIVTTSVQIGEITSVNASLRRQYNSLVSEENELRLQLETRDDLRIVENMAKTELGMVKKDEVERYYLTVRKEDRIEIIEETVVEKENLIDGVLRFGASIVERVRGFFGL
ncbi:MAG: hypothetical protein J6C52_02470, partial [Clostridia bacterium]|nr:hypothetical protein [Clostridia bacterium]